MKLSGQRWLLVLYDLIVWVVVATVLLIFHPSVEDEILIHRVSKWVLLGAGCIYIPRFLFNVYRQIWRYGNLGPYMLLILADTIGGLAFCAFAKLLPNPIRILLAAFIACSDLICCISMRMLYSFAYKYASHRNRYSKFWQRVIKILGHVDIKGESEEVYQYEQSKIPVAIVGAGHIGSELAQQLMSNPKSRYIPKCFVDVDTSKIGRSLQLLPILDERRSLEKPLANLGVREVIFALPELETVDKRMLYERYKTLGLKLNFYDHPIYDDVSDEKHIREFTLEDLLQRDPVDLSGELLANCYKGKSVLVTGGGGSIGSEMCRQIATLEPAKLVIMDIAENTSYDLQQELIIQFGKELPVYVEICNMCDAEELDILFAKYRPDIVIHAAAHKHVPLMEHNASECIKNNVAGTQNVINMCLKYGAEHFIMVSTDKAVNPTNVMGASKRVCELIVQSAAHNTDEYMASQGIAPADRRTVFSSTRFGNVLGSAGSVVPLFKKQIEAGGPVTLTDHRIIRYFMTIPEASQLVLTSGAMAGSGELFVLDMGEPVHIRDLAEAMIRLSGFVPYRDINIVETGLRPGEKLYEETLIDGDRHKKTANNLIYIETEDPISNDDLMNKLTELYAAAQAHGCARIKAALKELVPTYTCKSEE